MSKDSKKGWIYCISNPSFTKGLYKVGISTKVNIKDVLTELYTPNIPTHFVLRLAKSVLNPSDKEQKLNKLLIKLSPNNIYNTGFYTIPLDTIKSLFELIDGDFEKEVSVEESEDEESEGEESEEESEDEPKDTVAPVQVEADNKKTSVQVPVKK